MQEAGAERRQVLQSECRLAHGMSGGCTAGSDLASLFRSVGWHVETAGSDGRGHGASLAEVSVHLASAAHVEASNFQCRHLPFCILLGGCVWHLARLWLGERKRRVVALGVAETACESWRQRQCSDQPETMQELYKKWASFFRWHEADELRALPDKTDANLLNGDLLQRGGRSTAYDLCRAHELEPVCVQEALACGGTLLAMPLSAERLPLDREAAGLGLAVLRAEPAKTQSALLSAGVLQPSPSGGPTLRLGAYKRLFLQLAYVCVRPEAICFAVAVSSRSTRSVSTCCSHARSHGRVALPTFLSRSCRASARQAPGVRQGARQRRAAL